MRRVCLIFCAAAGLIGASVSAAAQDGGSLGADWGPQQGQARDCVRAKRCMPLKEVVAAVNRRTPGRLLDAGLEQQGGRDVYRVRWAASDGRRMDLIVDAASGQVLSQEGR